MQRRVYRGRAAERALVSQPALSAQIIEMEDSLGVTLVERSRGKTLLTRKGEEVLKHVRSPLRRSRRFNLRTGYPRFFFRNSTVRCQASSAAALS